MTKILIDTRFCELEHLVDEIEKIHSLGYVVNVEPFLQIGAFGNYEKYKVSIIKWYEEESK